MNVPSFDHKSRLSIHISSISIVKMRSLLVLSAALLSPALAVSISEINGNCFLSPYAGETVSNVEGLVTAKASSGLYLRSTEPDLDDRTSESIYIYGGAAVDEVNVSDIITLSGTVSEYRYSSSYIPPDGDYVSIGN